MVAASGSCMTAPRVLVADDDAMTLALVAEAMERAGYSVRRADDGDELLQALAEDGPFDLIVTDVAMPWMTGLQVAHSARTAGIDTPVLVMTASRIGSKDVEQIGGNTLLLRKPFGVTQLIGAAHQLLGGSAHER
jgi:CheY-like chemotaxis protein